MKFQCQETQTLRMRFVSTPSLGSAACQGLKCSAFIKSRFLMEKDPNHVYRKPVLKSKMVVCLRVTRTAKCVIPGLGRLMKPACSVLENI